MKLLQVLATAAVSYATVAIAQTERDLDSHVHGLASLNVAIADAAVFIELNTPWNNLVGFEHAPQTDEQHALVEETLRQLNDPALLFLFDAGDCVIDEVTLENGMSDDAQVEKHDEHGDEHGDESSTHTTVLATYSYECKKIERLKSIDVTLFSLWSGFEDLDVQLIGNKGQALVELNPNDTVINVEQVQ